MAYTIEWMEKKTTSTGKEKADCTLKDVGSGVMTEKVTIWGDFTGFAGLMPGSTVYGSIVPAKDPKYGPTLYAPKVQGSGSTGPTRSAGAINKAMETKASNIRDAQENKENGIKLSSTIRMAVDLAIAESSMDGSEPTPNKIEAWRKYLWASWDEPTDKQWPTV